MSTTPIVGAKHASPADRLVGVKQASPALGSRTKPGSLFPGVGFGSALRKELSKQTDVTFSAHATKRMAQRSVTLDEANQARLNAAVDRVQSKGADKSLVLLDGLALVVSARNRVVITAVDSASAREGVFTNIDSAVIA